MQEELAKLHAAIQAAEDHEGRLTAERILELAEDTASPLHPYFEWDDSVAAKQHRLNQARHLIQSVRVQITVEDKQVAVVAYVRDPQANGQGYIALPQLQGDEENAHVVLRREIDRALSYLARVENLAAALGLANAVAPARKTLEGLRSRVEVVAA